ncbi:nucleoprotein [Mosqueiro virus]|uniref:Nucleoprotein n=1 Tax=Mosqueiro virus TaxID=200403 RepID=A0A0D3R1X4_9RHAB|nr:nucleoprotein [Mosqueiro virus]AJR28517.1 nucleoprotein [Mosqueiro virus]
MKSVRSGNVIKYLAPADKVDPQYARAFFDSNGGATPSLTIEQSTYTLDQTRGIIHEGIMRGTLRVQHVIRYLYLVGGNITARLEDQWESHGVVIGNQGDIVNPFAMYQVTLDNQNTIDATGSPNVDADQDLWMTLYLLFVYRYSRVSNTNYQGALMDRFKVQVVSAYPNPGAFQTPKGVYKSWLNNKNYTKIVAGFDMFFCKFPKHDAAFLRFGTVTSRFRDCAALMALNHLRTTAKMEGDEIFGWMFLQQLEDEAYMLMKEDEELDKVDSYTPYMMDMGLSLKSPYSATACPSIYTWCHFIGSWLVSTRSRNARMISDAGIAELRSNAAIVAFVYSKNYNYQIRFTDKDDIIDGTNPINDMDDEYDSSDESSMMSISALPKSRDPLEWFCYLKGMQFQTPREIQIFITLEAQKMHNMRAGSIGKHLHEAYA